MSDITYKTTIEVFLNGKKTGTIKQDTFHYYYYIPTGVKDKPENRGLKYIKLQYIKNALAASL